MSLLYDCHLFLLKNEKTCNHGALRPDRRYNIIIVSNHAKSPFKVQCGFYQKTSLTTTSFQMRFVYSFIVGLSLYKSRFRNLYVKLLISSFGDNLISTSNVKEQ